MTMIPNVIIVVERRPLIEAMETRARKRWTKSEHRESEYFEEHLQMKKTQIKSRQLKTRYNPLQWRLQQKTTKNSAERSAECVRWFGCARDHTEIEPSNAAVQTRSALLNVRGRGDADDDEDAEDDEEFNDDEMMASDETEAACASESTTASCETAAIAVECGDDTDNEGSAETCSDSDDINASNSAASVGINSVFSADTRDREATRGLCR